MAFQENSEFAFITCLAHASRELDTFSGDVCENSQLLYGDSAETGLFDSKMTLLWDFSESQTFPRNL